MTVGAGMTIGSGMPIEEKPLGMKKGLNSLSFYCLTHVTLSGLVVNVVEPSEGSFRQWAQKDSSSPGMVFEYKTGFTGVPQNDNLDGNTI